MTAGLTVAVGHARHALAICLLTQRAVRLRVDAARERGVLNPETCLRGTENATLDALRGAAAGLRAALSELAGGDPRAAERQIRSATAHARLAVMRVRPDWLDTEDPRGGVEVEDQLAELVSLAEAAALPAAPVQAAA